MPWPELGACPVDARVSKDTNCRDSGVYVGTARANNGTELT